MKLPVGARVGKNAVALLAAGVGARLLALLFNAYLGRTLGVAALGRYLTMLAVEGLTLACISLGLNVYATREFSRHERQEETETLLGAVLGARVSTALLGMAALNGLIGPLFYSPAQRVLLGVISLGLLPDAVIGVCGALVRARQRMEISSGIDVGARLLAALLGATALWRGYNETWALAAYVLGRIAAAAALGWVIWRWGLRPRWRFGTVWGPLLRESLPFAIVDIAAIVYRKFDLLLLPRWHGDAAAGVYGAAYSLWENLGLIPGSLLEALFPEMVRRTASARRTASDGIASLRQLYRRGQYALAALVLLMTAGFALAAPPAFRLLYGEMMGRAEAATVFRWLLAGLPFTYLYLLDGNLLYATDRQRAVTGWMLVVTLLNGALNLLLIPRWSVWAATGVAVFSSAALFAALRFEARRALAVGVAERGVAS